MEGLGETSQGPPAGGSKLPLCKDCVASATATFIQGDCCAYGSVKKLVEGLMDRNKALDMEVARSGLEAGSLVAAKEVGHKKAEALEEKLKKVSELRTKLEKELAEAKDLIKSQEEKIAKLEAQRGEPMATDPAPAVKQKPFPMSMIAVGDKTMIPLRDDVHLWEELGGSGAMAMWSAYQETITDCCDRVRRHLKEEKDGKVHVLVMSGAKDVMDGVPKGLCGQNIAKAMATQLVALRRHSDRVISIMLCSMVEHPDCPNIAEVNTALRDSVEAIRGEFEFVDLRNISRDRRFISLESGKDDPYKATYTREGYKVIKSILLEKILCRLAPDEATLARITERREMLMESLRQKQEAKLEREKRRKENEDEKLRKLRTAAAKEEKEARDPRASGSQPANKRRREDPRDDRRSGDGRPGKNAPRTHPEDRRGRVERPPTALPPPR
jgi:hypothetical protein